MKQTIASALSEERFLAKAFTEYIEDKANNYGIILELLSKVTEESEELVGKTAHEIGLWIQSNTGFDPGVVVPSTVGYVKLSSLIIEMLDQIESDEVDESAVEEDSIYVHTNTHDQELVSVANILQSLNSDYHATISMAAAAFSFRADEIASRVTLFNDYISRFFKDSYNDISGVAIYARSALDNSLNFTDFLSAFESSVGLENPEPAIGSSVNDMSSYTGASPIGPISFDGAVDAVVTVATTTYNAAKSVIKGFFGLGKKLFKAAKEKLVEVAINPYDVIDSGNPLHDYEVQGFKISESGVEGTSLIVEGWDPIRNASLNAWIKDKPMSIGTIFGTYEFVVRDISLTYVEGQTDSTRIQFIYDQSFSPSSYSYKALNLIDNAGGQLVGARMIEEVRDLAISLSQNASYMDAGNTEADLYKSFANSLIAFTQFGRYAFLESTGTVYGNALKSSVHEFIIPSTVTNLDFVKLLSGWKVDDQIFANDGSGLANDTGKLFEGFWWVMSVVINRMERLKNPTDYPFFPYLTGHDITDGKRFSIVTDEQNRAAFNKFIAVTTIVVAVVVIGGIAFLKLKKAGRMAAFTANGLQTKIQNTLANGDTPDASMLKAWKKARKKAKLLGFATVGLVSATATEIPLISNSDVIELIK